MVFARASLTLTNYFLPLNVALNCQNQGEKVMNSHISILFTCFLYAILIAKLAHSQPVSVEPSLSTTTEYGSHFLGGESDVFSVEAKSAHVHRIEYKNSEKHQFHLISAFPLTVGGRITYQTDVVRVSASPFLIRRLAVINKSDVEVAFKLNIKPLSLPEFKHTEVLNESSTVVARGTHGFHFERADKHQYYLASIYPTRKNARLMYEWDNVRDANSSGFIRRLNVINKSNFPAEFEIKVIKIDAQTASGIGTGRKSGLVKTERFNNTSSVQANGQHGFHFERINRHAFYLASLYPLTEQGRLTYEWDNVRDPGSSGFIRRLTVINKSNKPVEFKLRVAEVKPVEGVLKPSAGNMPVAKSELIFSDNKNNSSEIVVFAKSVEISLECSSAGSDMNKICQRNQAATTCAQIDCQIDNEKHDGKRRNLKEVYDSALCSEFEASCGFGSGSGGGGSGSGGFNQVKCSWIDIGCRIVHTGNDNWWF